MVDFPELSLELITKNRGVAMDAEDAPDFGEGSMLATVDGQIMQVTIKKDDKPFIKLKIDEHGNITVTNFPTYQGVLMGKYYHIINMNPW